jgi:putative peptidoglycan lipid II flippase
MAAFVLSRVLGLVRDSLLGSTFGAGAELDAYTAAARVTETLYYLVAGGALASAFIPTFTAYLARDERETAWQVASAVINLVLVVTVVASLVAALIAPWLVANVLAPDYQPEVQALTVSLLRWMLASTVIFGVSGLLMGILNANDHFLLPALAPSFYNLGILLGIVLLARRGGIHGVAVGTVIGAALHLLVQLPALHGTGGTYTPTLGLRLNAPAARGVRNVGRLMLPRVLGLAITQLNFWVNVNLGSRIGVEGVVSALKLGFSLMLLPQGVLAQAAATVLLPTFSAQAARGEQDELRATLTSASQAIWYLTLPATVGLIALSGPIVEMFFKRAAFDDQDVAMVAWALVWYAVGLVAHSLLEIVTRAFYALHDTMTPVWVGGGAMVLNLVLSIVFAWGLERVGRTYWATAYQPWMPLGGLALANSLATILETATLSLLLHGRLTKAGAQATRTGSIRRTGLGSALMAAVLWAFMRLAPTQNPWLLGGGGALVGLGSYLIATLLLRSPEPRLALAAVRKRFGRS